MKTFIQVITACIVLASVAASCKKQDISSPQNDFTHFRIEKITGTFAVNQGMSFTYNNQGDPISISAIGSGTNYESDRYFFNYDVNGKLVEFMAPYTWISAVQFKFWHRYGYDAQGRISVDSLYMYGSKVNDRPESDQKEIDFFQYDAQSRIIRVYTKDSTGKQKTLAKYTYDSNGNRSDISKHYDDKINFHRTNKIWQFLDRDYSMNNPLDIQTYPSYTLCGLPENIETTRVGLKQFLDFQYTFMIVSYSAN